MLVASISILDAAVARWFLTFLAPPGPPGPPPVFVATPPALAAYVLLVVAMVHDWRKTGRVHPVYYWCGGVLVAIKFVQIPLSETAVWHGIAGWVLSLAR